MGIMMDTFVPLSDNNDHDIEIEEEASGSFEFVASHKPGADNKFRDTMNLVTGFLDLADGDGTALAHGDDDDSYLPTDENFDATNDVNATIPRYLTVFRRIGEAGTTFVDYNATNDTTWVKFRAQGERIDAMALAAKTTTADKTFTVSIVTDSSGTPTDSLVSGMSASATQTCAHSTFSGTKWAVISTHSSWSDADRLTVGTDYWLRITRTDSNSGNFFLATADTRQDYAGLYTDDNAAIADATPNTTQEVVHYIKFKKTEGLKVVVYDYIDQAETGGLIWTFDKVKLESVVPSFANKQATRATVSWKCNDWAFDEIT